MPEQRLKAGVPDDYVPSAGEVDNFVYLVLKYGGGWHMRACDLAVVRMGAGEVRGEEGLERLLEGAADYLWDHILGETDETSPEAIRERMRPVLEAWYAGTTPEERAVTG